MESQERERQKREAEAGTRKGEAGSGMDTIDLRFKGKIGVNQQLLDFPSEIYSNSQLRSLGQYKSAPIPGGSKYRAV